MVAAYFGSLQQTATILVSVYSLSGASRPTNRYPFMFPTARMMMKTTTNLMNKVISLCEKMTNVDYFKKEE